MAISFDDLPNNKPVNTINKGTYYATIESAEMRQPKDPTKPLYLNLLLALKDSSGKSAGKIYDIITESDKPLLKYKLARFIKALRLENTLTTFELSDLCKIIKNKELIVDVVPEKKDNEETGRSIVDVFTNEIYYQISEAKDVFKGPPVGLEVINENDAEDSPIADESVHNDINSDDIF